LLEHYPLDRLLHVVPAGLLLVAPDRTIVYWSDEAERITGYRAAEVLGRSCDDLHAQPCNADCCLFDDAMCGPLMGQTCSFVHKDGRRLSLNKNVDLLRNAAGEIIGGIEAFVDRTGYEEVELERNALRSVLNGMNDPVYICDHSYRLLFVNRAMERLLGAITGQLCYHALYGRTEACLDCPLETVLQGGSGRQETSLIDTQRIFEVLHSACQFHRQPHCKLGVCRDITERLAIRRRLQQVNRELDAFVSMVSHDLRSPLTPLIGFAELLQERYAAALDEIGQESLGQIRTTAEKMRELLEDLLCLARVGQSAPVAAPVATEAVVREVLAELDELVQQRQPRIVIGFLPEVMISEALLADLYRNLLSNALKYGAGHDPRIEIFGQLTPELVSLMVRDHGVGVAVAERERIFEPFVRGCAGKDLPGTGIGLATVVKIARVYSGNVRIEETPGGGATFVVDFPVEPGVADGSIG
jgi:PAS domain S-box-containing protein